MVKIKKLRVKKQQLKNLPIFYNSITYNELINVDAIIMPLYSTKLNSYIPFSKPDKLTSKIIDFSLLNDALND